MAEFLLELLSEEIPARMQAKAADDLKRLVTDGLKAEGLAFDRADAYVTPRRLTLVVQGLPQRTPDVEEEKKGPRVGAPQQAIDGFLRSLGGMTLEQCEQRDSGKGAFYFAVLKKEGRPAADALADVVARVAAEFPWPKSMKAAVDRRADGDRHGPVGNTAMAWVRPLKSVLAIFDGAALPGGLDLGFSGPPFVAPDHRKAAADMAGAPRAYGDVTVGHRFLAPEPFAVKDFTDYRAAMSKRFVMLDREERKTIILNQAKALAASEGLELVDDPGLLEEVAGLVEWPKCLMGRIDDQFMSVPAEALTTSMRAHQKYFATRKPDGSLGPRFVVVSQPTPEAGSEDIVVAGNERVLRARLSDAKFFWDQDRKTPLESRLAALEDIVFHAKLGTVAERVRRMELLAEELAAFIPGCDPLKARRAARLAKADLVTGMVGEFPELQGIMGRYYALDQGEDAEVADAIAEHYGPKGPDDRCPTAPVSVAVALAEKLDTLAGFFAVDEKPTGSKDPYALRRAALGVIRLIVENGLRLELLTVFRSILESYAPTLYRNLHDVADVERAARTLYRAHLIDEVDLDVIAHEYEPDVRAKAREVGRTARLGMDALLAFFADRLKVALREQGVRHDLIDAVFSLGGEDDLVRLLARVRALSDFLRSDEGENLLIAYRRAANIVRIEEKKDGVVYKGEVDQSALLADEEKALAAALEKAQAHSAEALKREDFAAAMAALAALRGPVDAFFDKVTVNAEDAALRANRLRLLAKIGATLDQVADFSKVEGG